MRLQWPKWQQVTLRVVLPVVILTLLWHWLDGQVIAQLLLNAQLSWLLLGLVLLVTQTVLSALRWQLTAKQLGQFITTTRAISEYFLSMLCNLTLPGGVVGDAGRVWRGRDEVGLKRAAAAVFLDRVAGQIAMVAALIAGLFMAWINAATGRSEQAGQGIWLLLACLTILGVLLWRGPRWLRAVGQVVHVAWLTRAAWPGQLTLSLLIVSCNLGAFAACAAAVGAHLTWEHALVVLPLTLAVMVLPVSVAGWGVREAAAAALWPMASISSELAVAASIAYGLVATASALPGLVVPYCKNWLNTSPGPRTKSM
jgi:uncharacterized membrane protein YbhN (UPF0104 family)